MSREPKFMEGCIVEWGKPTPFDHICIGGLIVMAIGVFVLWGYLVFTGCLS